MRTAPWWLTWLVLPLLGLILVFMVVSWVVGMLLGVIFYLVLGAFVVLAAYVLIRRVTAAIARRF